MVELITVRWIGTQWQAACSSSSQKGSCQFLILKVLLEPGQRQVVNVTMAKDPQAQYPDATAEVKTLVRPNRAAVFVDDRFVGFVDQFDGPGQWLLLAPGKHRFKITLPGYKTFETEVSLLANQKFELKTDLFKGSIMESGPLMKEKGSEVAQTK